MKFARFRASGQPPQVGVVDGDHVTPLLDAERRSIGCLRTLIAQGPDTAIVPHGPPLPASSVSWLPPIARPEKIFCIGLNYADHAAEQKATVADLPVVFSKFSSCLIGAGAPVRLPEISQQVDFEAELVVVIGKSGRRIPAERAREHIFGLTCGNDVSARDWQKGRPGGQWLLGKTMDSFGPLGPWVVTADEFPWPPQLDISLRLNGQTMQASNTRQLIFSIDYLLAHLSRFCRLSPGDLIFTGTPGGVGMARQPPRFLQPGDQLEVEIERIGRLANPVIAEG